MGESGASATGLTVPQVQQLLIDRLGLRIGPEVAAYVLRRWQAAMGAIEGSPPAAVPVMGGDARTGIPAVRPFELALLATDHARLSLSKPGQSPE